MTSRTKAFAPGEEATILLRFVYEGGEEVESVEAVFAREGAGEEIAFLGDAEEELREGASKGRYVARLAARIGRDAAPGEYRCVRLSVRNTLDDDVEFAEAASLDLIVRVERAPRRLEVVESDFL